MASREDQPRTGLEQKVALRVCSDTVGRTCSCRNGTSGGRELSMAETISEMLLDGFQLV